MVVVVKRVGDGGGKKRRLGTAKRTRSMQRCRNFDTHALSRWSSLYPMKT